MTPKQPQKSERYSSRSTVAVAATLFSVHERRAHLKCPMLVSYTLRTSSSTASFSPGSAARAAASGKSLLPALPTMPPPPPPSPFTFTTPNPVQSTFVSSGASSRVHTRPFSSAGAPGATGPVRVEGPPPSRPPAAGVDSVPCRGTSPVWLWLWLWPCRFRCRATPCCSKRWNS